MIGQMGSFEYPSAGLDEPLDCYIHGYISARMMNLARASDGEGLPLCISATKVDGLILSLTPFSHSYNYRSAVLHGYGTLVTDEKEKLHAMKLITNSVVPDRWDNSRTPPDGGELASTALLKVRIVDGSGKIRDGGVSDEKKDYQNEETTKRIWTGVVPVWETFGEPIPSPENQVKDLPEYIKNYTSEVNERNRSYAFDATKIKLPKEEQH
jgi:nitroimidazol reductase NimA-like FMN-containing flavoprotein (pyridoxamine 5'-phosphate oxidase superfamily)